MFALLLREGEAGLRLLAPPSYPLPSSDLSATNACFSCPPLSMAIKTSIMYHVTASGKITFEARKRGIGKNGLGYSVRNDARDLMGMEPLFSPRCNIRG